MISAIIYNQPSVSSNISYLSAQRPSINELELAARGDVISIHHPEQMTDADIDQALQSIENNLNESPTEAMSVYGNLDYSRVMALLNDPI